MAPTRLADHLPSIATAVAHHHPEDTPVLSDSYNGLPLSTARAYRLLTCVPTGTIDVYGAAAALSLNWHEAARELTVLTEAGLLEDLVDQGQSPTFRFHSEVREHAEHVAQRDETEERRTAAVRRWCEWLLVTASQAERLLTPAHRALDQAVTSLSLTAPPFGTEEGARKWIAAHQDAVEPARSLLLRALEIAEETSPRDVRESRKQLDDLPGQPETVSVPKPDSAVDGAAT
ncbi:hypothetical protein ACFXO2_30120 [Streptomyces sp. NPDC059152]|uniref:hypothetical protein n=1 Tax=Streptomyces sp. NPDC059152 TaxID=3346742 RepID=UPI00367D4162